jgi:hypothetical protein
VLVVVAGWIKSECGYEISTDVPFVTTLLLPPFGSCFYFFDLLLRSLSLILSCAHFSSIVDFIVLRLQCKALSLTVVILFVAPVEPILTL